MSLLEFFQDRLVHIDYLNLTSEIIKENQDKIDWSIVSWEASLPILIEFEDKIDWKLASENDNLSIELIHRHQNEIDWRFISFRCSSEIIKEFEDRINFFHVSWNKNLTLDFIEKHKSKLHPTHNILNIISRTDLNLFDWDEISEDADLQTLTAFEDRINWLVASKNPNLNIALIKKHINQVSWFTLSEIGSLEILITFHNYIIPEIAMDNYNATNELKIEYYSLSLN